MSLETVIQAALYKISGGSDFRWKCYGHDARILDFSTQSVEDVASVVFDADNQTVYEINFFPEDGKYYRWINPDFFEAYVKEAISRNIDYHIALDDIKWIDCDLEIDITEKINTYFTNGTYDERVMITLELSDEMHEALISIAKEKGITIDEYANEILVDIIEKKEQIE